MTLPLFSAGQETLTSDDYYTPSWIFDKLGLVFDLDVAAPPGGVPHIPANRVLTMAEDGLTTEWHGQVWMNPPWSGPQPWVTKFVDHACGVGLIPGSKSAWFNTLWENPEVAIVALPSNMKFVQGSVPLPALLIAMSTPCIDALSRIGRVR